MTTDYKIPLNATPEVKAIIEYVNAWYDITFQYEGKTFTVLGALVVQDNDRRVCLWGDVLAIDKTEQKLVGSKCFYADRLQGPVDKGKMHGKCANDYWSVELNARDVYVRGPKWPHEPHRRTPTKRLKCPSEPAGKTKKVQTDREKFEALFSPKGKC